MEEGAYITCSKLQVIYMAKLGIKRQVLSTVYYKMQKIRVVLILLLTN